jgi:hypothetical protein
MTLGSTQPLVKMSTRNIPGDKWGRCVRLTTSSPSRAECHEIWESKPPGTLWATPDLLGTPLPLPFLVSPLRKKYCLLTHEAEYRSRDYTAASCVSSPLPCHHVTLRPKYLPQHPFLECPQPTFLPQCESKFHTRTEEQAKLYFDVHTVVLCIIRTDKRTNIYIKIFY